MKFGLCVILVCVLLFVTACSAIPAASQALPLSSPTLKPTVAVSSAGAPDLTPAPSATPTAAPLPSPDPTPLALLTGDSKVQSGAVCGGDGFIFFTVEDPDVQYSVDYDRVSYIYASKADGSDRRAIFQGCLIDSLTYTDGWLYFLSDGRDEEINGVMRIRPDGSGLENILPCNYSLTMVIYHDVIYVLSYNGDFLGTYTMGLDGQDQQLLFKHPEENDRVMLMDSLLDVNEDFLFYLGERWPEEDADSPNYYLVKKDIRSGAETELFECGFEMQIQVIGHTLVYTDYYMNNIVIRTMDLNSDKIQRLITINNDMHASLPIFCIADTMVIYAATDYNKETHLYCFDLTSGNTQSFGTMPTDTYDRVILFSTAEGVYYACVDINDEIGSLYRIELSDTKVELTQVY